MILQFLFIATALATELSNPLNGSLSVDVTGSGQTAVIFVHGYDGDKRNFEYLSGKIASRGLVTVNFDLNGHGSRSQGSKEFLFMHRDVRTIIHYLQQQNITDIQCVGEGVGGIICLQANSEKTPISQVAIISPVGLFEHQSIFLHIEEYQKRSFRPIYVIVSNQDENGIRTTKRLEEQVDVLANFVDTDGTGEGVSLIRQNLHLERELINWIIRAPNVQQDIESLPPVKVGPASGKPKR